MKKNMILVKQSIIFNNDISFTDHLTLNHVKYLNERTNKYFSIFV